MNIVGYTGWLIEMQQQVFDLSGALAELCEVQGLSPGENAVMNTACDCVVYLGISIAQRVRWYNDHKTADKETIPGPSEGGRVG